METAFCALAGAQWPVDAGPVDAGPEQGGFGRYAARVAVAVENLAMAFSFEFGVVRRRFFAGAGARAQAGGAAVAVGEGLLMLPVNGPPGPNGKPPSPASSGFAFPGRMQMLRQ